MELIEKSSYSQSFMNSVLKCFCAISEYIYFYLNLSRDCLFFQNQILKLIKAYRDIQVEKISGTNSLHSPLDELDENNFLKGLSTIVQILNYTISKIFNSSKTDANEEGPSIIVLNGNVFLNN